MGRYMSGQSIRSIAREEDRDRDTITRIVRSIEMQEIIRVQRERFFALAPKAVEALETVLELAEDGRLARDVLMDMGVIPTRWEREAVLSGDPEIRRRAAELLERLEVGTAPETAESEEEAGDSTAKTDRNDESKKSPANNETKPSGS